MMTAGNYQSHGDAGTNSVGGERPTTADEGLRRLMDGNARFLKGTARFPTIQKDVLTSLAHAQHPYATIIGCSDSRVPPELLFDANFGELFVIRVAGNVYSPEIAGSLQYAGVHLRTPLFVVLGHENCGAVQAALDVKFRKLTEPSRIELLLQDIMPCLEHVDEHAEPAHQMRMAVEANVRWTMRQISETPEVRARMADGVYKLVGAVCNIKNGRVRFIK
jgi:carbonic anhydrase